MGDITQHLNRSIKMSIQRANRVALFVMLTLLGISAAVLIWGNYIFRYDVADDYAPAQSGGQLADAYHYALDATLVCNGLLAFAILGYLIWIQKHVLTPIVVLSNTVTKMADGDFKAVQLTDHRNDELGQITRAMEIFRAAGAAQADTSSNQTHVVSTLRQAFDRLASGDLSHRIEETFANEYESLRGSFNEAIARLSDTLSKVSASASTVGTGAGEIRAASDDLANRNERQAASLEETAASMKHVTQLVKQSADNATVARNAVAATHQQATDGGVVVGRAVESMASIEKSAAEITQIIDVIDGIAFQTNLLALNAGVEAARAGDAGKGFAVVANEVRALAQRSADAASDIKNLIMRSSEQVDAGVAQVGEAGELLSTILSGVAEINDQIVQIEEMAKSQATSLEQVGSAVTELDRMTQQNAAMVEQSTAAARSLADEASQLTGLVSTFCLDRSSVRPTAFASARTGTKARPRSVPVVSGNLALQLQTDEQDWHEF